MKKFAAFDIDGTLIRWQLYHALIDGLVKRGYIDPSDFPSVKESRMAWKNRGHIEAFKAYERELVAFYETNIKHLQANHFSQVVDDVFKEYKDQVYIYTRDLLKDLKSKDYLLFAISGSQIEIVQKIADYYGFDDYSGTSYLQEGGKFSGEVIFNAGDKDKVLKGLMKKHNASITGSMALGDSAGDIKMMDLVENPIAFNPEKKLFDYAQGKNWKVVLERKNMVYELENKNGQYELV
jgi:HAD superfamily hydrolase (TIGR01490 family)